VHDIADGNANYFGDVQHPFLRLILRPCLLAALALEHADRAASFGIEHRPNHGGFLVALAACPDRIRVVAGKDLVLELIVHG
jgi:hypothetical protein